jgi:hypothetical protein
LAPADTRRLVADLFAAVHRNPIKRAKVKVGVVAVPEREVFFFFFQAPFSSGRRQR